MIIKDIIDEDYQDYKVPSMLIATSKCSWKCGVGCQNRPLSLQPDVNSKDSEIVDRYLRNYLTHAIVIAGLEPFDQFDELIQLVSAFRERTLDDIVIYTGYDTGEVMFMTSILMKYENIIVKFGRYVPGNEPHFDDVLGVKLSSDNQFAKRIS